MINKYRNPIFINLEDLYGFQRKAFYKILIDNTDTETTSIFVTIKWYKDNVEFSDERRGIKPYEKEIKADNTTLVNMNTGLPELDISEFINLYKGIDEEGNITWHKDTPNYYMGESDFYCYVRDNHPVLLKDLIIGAMERASQRGIL